MSQATSPDSGIRNHRVEFVREDAPGATPADPSWNLFSDTLETALQVESDAQIEQLQGVGDVNPTDHFAGPEDHTASIEYHLQQFFVDSNGDPLDASADAIQRAANGGVQNTHTIVDRRDEADTRVYRVVRGAYPNVDELSGDPGSGLPLVMALEYEAKRARSYKVGQPSGETLSVKSTSADDTSQTLTIESDGATESEDVSLDGTTAVATTASFDSIDALELDAETQGDVVVSDSSDNELARIHGANEYDGAGGDLGIPALGSGSHADPIGSEYERFLDDQITRGAEDLAVEVRSAGLSVSNNYDKSGVMGTTEQAVHVGQQSAEFTATVAGQFAQHEHLHEHLTAQDFDITWTLSGGTITFSGAVLSDLGDIGPSSGDVISTMDNTFSPTGVSISSN